MEFQRTIRQTVSYKGMSLHTGEEVTVTLEPAGAGKGVIFVRTDLPDSPWIKAEACKVVSNMRGTSIGEGGVKITTVEHILAALSGLGVDNIIIKMNGEEFPAGDGSALPFVELIQRTGTVEQDEPRSFFKVREPFWIGQGDKRLIVVPANEFRITYTVDFSHSFLNSQFAEFVINERTFVEEIAPSRTFGFMEEIEMLKEKGLIRGGSLKNAVVIDSKGVINKEGFRFPNEPVRHKILDLIGDLYLIGKPVKAHIVAVKTGHLYHVKLAQKMEELIRRENEENISLDMKAIQKILPHRYPFLLVDKILSIGKQEIVGLKNFTVNEPFFEGHFPGHPVVPAALIVEAMAQVAGVYLLRKSENQGKLAYFAGIDKARFRKPVVPGDQLITRVKMLNLRKKTGKVEAISTVEGEIAAEAVFIFSLVER